MWGARTANAEVHWTTKIKTTLQDVMFGGDRKIFIPSASPVSNTGKRPCGDLDGLFA